MLHESPGAFSYLLVQPQAPCPLSASLLLSVHGYSEKVNNGPDTIITCSFSRGHFSPRDAFQCDGKKRKEKDQALEPVYVQDIERRCRIAAG